MREVLNVPQGWESIKLNEVLEYEQPTKYLVKTENYDNAFNTPVLTAGKTFILGYTDEKDGIFKSNLPVIIFDDFTTSSKFVDFNFKAKSSAMKILKLKDNLANIKLVFELMQKLNFAPEEHKRHWISTYSKLKINLPKSKKEQEKIAEILSEVDSAIEHAQALHVKHQKVKTALMQDLLTHGIDQHGKIRNPKTHAYKPSLLGDVPVEWDVKELQKILKIGSGQDYKFLQEGAIPVYGTGGYMTSVNNFLYDGESVCIGRKGTIDNPMYLEGKFWTVDTLFYTHKFKQSVPKYIYYVFQNINWKLYNEASGVPSLSKTTIENIQIKIPQQEEQQKIAQILSSHDDKIEKVKTKLEKLQQLKTALMQDLLNGTKRVNHLLGEEQ
ncbi:MAG: restriction endonuclease subunit S [Sulfurospirillaceae bacterium]|nr:restriction endonuclease subunit S [Sulfurospirillaceae bacterium]